MSRWWTWGVLMAMTLAMASCASWQAKYLKGAANQATTDEVEKQLGRPYSTWRLTTGEILWTYQAGVPSGADAGGITIVGPGWIIGRRSDCTQYVLLFDPQKVLRTWMRQPCRPGRHVGRVPTNPAPSILQARSAIPTHPDPDDNL